MNKNLSLLQSLLFVVFFFMATALINDAIDINVSDLTHRPIYQKALKGEHASFFTSEASLRYSAYFVKVLKIGVRVYLLYGMFALFQIIQKFKKQEFFSKEVALSFRKTGGIFIGYCMYMLALEFVYLFITLDSAPVIELLQSNGIDVIALCGIAFSTLSHVFLEGKSMKDENELTI